MFGRNASSRGLERLGPLSYQVGLLERSIQDPVFVASSLAGLGVGACSRDRLEIDSALCHTLEQWMQGRVLGDVVNIDRTFAVALRYALESCSRDTVPGWTWLL